jgi:hypothetical protein
MEADSGGSFTYGGGFWRRLFYNVYIKGMSGVFLKIWRRMSGRISEAVSNLEAGSGGNFNNMKADFGGG